MDFPTIHTNFSGHSHWCSCRINRDVADQMAFPS